MSEPKETGDDFKVTPWEVVGNIDYDKLIKQFGTQLLDDTLQKRIKKHTGELPTMLRRKIFFSHRDLKWLLDEYDKGNKFFLYTGRAPSGHTHLGHLVPWMFTKWMQDKYGADLWFQFPDEEKFLFKKGLTLEDTEKFTYENMLDVIALGFKPKNTHFIVDTKHANLMYKEAIKVARKITFSTAKATFGFSGETNIGAIFYTSMQAVLAFLPSVLAKKNIPCLIPHAIDQDPHFRITRDIIPKLGHYKPASIHCRFLPGLGEGGKMSASEPNTTIFTVDDEKTVNKKIMRAFTGGQESAEEQKKLGGNPDICPIFHYYSILFEEDDKELAKIKSDCKCGKLLCGEDKKRLASRINKFLKEHQKKREKAKDKINDFIFKNK